MHKKLIDYKMADLPIKKRRFLYHSRTPEEPNSSEHLGEPDQLLGKSIPKRTDRLHWDLNIMMNEWEEPYAEFVNTEKTSATLETHDNNPPLDRPEREFIEQKNNSADIPVQCDKDMSGTPATVMCKLSSQSDTTEKNDSVSFGMPFIIGKPAYFVDSMKDEGSENLKINSGKEPKLASEDLSSGCNNSNFSGNNMGHGINVECMNSLQSGYDSPIEDGEIREPDAYFWKNNNVDCLKTKQLNNGMVGTDYIDDNAKGQDGELDDGSQSREFGARKHRRRPSWKNQNNGCKVEFPVTYQESRSYNSRSYRDSKDSGPPARGSEMSFNSNMQSSDKFSNDIYRPPTRKRLTADRDDSNDSYMRAPPVRGNKKRNKKNKNKNKKSGFYPQRDRGEPNAEHNKHLPENYSSIRDHRSSTSFDQATHMRFDQATHMRRTYKSQIESYLSASTHVSNEQGSVSRHSQWQRGSHAEFPKKMKSDGNLRSSARQERNSQVVAKGRECSSGNSDYDKSVHRMRDDLNRN